jgi:LytS/YehU family sensor histidine kinase
MLLVAVFGRSAASSVNWWHNAERSYFMQLDWLLMTYGCLVGLAYALTYRGESEERALRESHLHGKLVEAQLQALQQQLHPHFLFNALNTISGLMQQNIDAADVMIDRLGELLRMTLRSSNTQEVRLNEELEVLSTYLDIERVRWGARLTIETNIQSETLDAFVPNLLLQPIVENAIRHGIAHSRPGRLEISAVRLDGRLHIEIRDSGDGLAPDHLLAFNRGTGLGNTRARLSHLYGAAHQLVCSNEPSGGFSVKVTMPFRVERVLAPSLAEGAA